MYSHVYPMFNGFIGLICLLFKYIVILLSSVLHAMNIKKALQQCLCLQHIDVCMSTSYGTSSWNETNYMLNVIRL